VEETFAVNNPHPSAVPLDWSCSPTLGLPALVWLCSPTLATLARDQPTCSVLCSDRLCASMRREFAWMKKPTAPKALMTCSAGSSRGAMVCHVVMKHPASQRGAGLPRTNCEHTAPEHTAAAVATGKGSGCGGGAPCALVASWPLGEAWLATQHVLTSMPCRDSSTCTKIWLAVSPVQRFSTVAAGR